MITFTSFLVFCQALSALLGALSAVWGEVAYIRAMRDGRIDDAERAHLHHIAWGLRFGMSTLLLSSFGLIIISYVTHTVLQPALSPIYWVFIALAFLVIGISWALSRRRISFAVGSAITFSGWWFLTYLAFGQIPELSFGTAAIFFIVATVILYVVLSSIRFFSLHKN